MVITEFALDAGGDQYVCLSISEEVTWLILHSRLSFFTSAFPFLDSLDYVILYFPFVATSPVSLHHLVHQTKNLMPVVRHSSRNLIPPPSPPSAQAPACTLMLEVLLL